MEPLLARAKALKEKRSLVGWIFLLLAGIWYYVLPTIQNVEWITEKFGRSTWIMPIGPPIILAVLALIWFLIVIFWPPREIATPSIVLVRYGNPPQAGISHGLFIANDSEVPAYEISIPDISLGSLTVTFSCNLPRLVKAEGEQFCEAWIKRGPNDEIGGSALFGEMVRLNVEAIDVPVRFKNGENCWYQTMCRIERDVATTAGLRVAYVKRETIKQRGC